MAGRRARLPAPTAQQARQRDARRLDEVTRLSFAADIEALVQWLAVADGPWGDAAPYSRGTIRVTVEELGAFFEDYIALIDRYARRGEQAPDGARTVATRLLAFPADEEET